jgi:hypothetical protein
VPVTVAAAHPPPPPPPPQTWRLEFNASADHDTNVTSYRLDVFASGLDPNTATALRSLDIGKPTPSGGLISADITSLISPLPAGNYQLTVLAIGPGGNTRSAPVAFTR